MVRSVGLPVAGYGLVGRGRELEALASLLSDPDVRLVTVTGTGGVGKTRLAVEAATVAADTFPGGVFMVDLAAVDRAEYVTSALLQTADAPASGADGLDALVAWLRGRRVLLLDNFEHVLAAAPIVATLLGRAPDLTCLATSRVRLHLSAEREQPLAPYPCTIWIPARRPALRSGC